jgi:ABC-2 type transport system ATP-binding protein
MLKIQHLQRLRHIGRELVDVSFSVDKSEAVAIVGPNGAGKSALLATIADPAHAAGTVDVSHFNAKTEPEKARMHLGYLPSPVVLEQYLTAFEYLHLVGSMYHLAPRARTERILQLAQELNCTHFLYTLLERHGPALHQKVALMAALIHQPAVIVLDDPTANLDPSSEEQVAKLLTAVVRKGSSLVFATNNLGFAQAIADRIIIFDQGQVVAEGTLAQLHHQMRSKEKDLRSIYHHALRV